MAYHTPAGATDYYAPKAAPTAKFCDGLYAELRNSYNARTVGLSVLKSSDTQTDNFSRVRQV
ncbi:hypothetical protein CFIMG_004287RA [Ceratocystis fimbriata CBS 114723]|uniref:Uncharacterized protein n=1 Tax=Ceratocystis fimbriata CBS 114723 TaxID=1035309 RepID=A0A2C5X1P9_9PEZI|nr:hypothetical protein CFIMG_004287RA [Ceratocystis fimbriata CBS 114723]